MDSLALRGGALRTLVLVALVALAGFPAGASAHDADPTTDGVQPHAIGPYLVTDTVAFDSSTGTMVAKYEVTVPDGAPDLGRMTLQLFFCIPEHHEQLDMGGTVTYDGDPSTGIEGEAGIWPANQQPGTTATYSYTVIPGRWYVGERQLALLGDQVYTGTVEAISCVASIVRPYVIPPPPRNDPIPVVVVPPVAEPAPAQPVTPAPATPAPAQLVLGERLVAGTARLVAPTGCARSAFSARVLGKRMSKVVFRLDGHVLKATKRGSTLWAVGVKPSGLSYGVHRLVADVSFSTGTTPRSKRLRVSFQRCAQHLAAPRFTG